MTNTGLSRRQALLAALTSYGACAALAKSWSAYAAGASKSGSDASLGRFDPRSLDPSNTGVKTGAHLTPSVAVATSRDGQMIENLDIEGRVTVTHKDVTISNCRIKGDGLYGIIAAPDQSDVSGLKVRFCEVSHATNGVAAVGLVERCNIHSCDNGINVWGPMTIVENYIHDLKSQQPDGHNDGVENNGSGMTLLRNRIECSIENDTSAVMTNNLFGSLVDVLIEGNYLSGGQYTVYCDGQKSDKPIENFVIRDNVIKRGRYGAFYLRGLGASVVPESNLVF